jgi:putative inorganic carbon (HCO3(-)) transporter
LIAKLKSNWIYLLAFAFIAINCLFLYAEVFWLALLPVAIALLLTAVISLDKLMWFVVFCTPLSFNIENLEIGGIGMYVPTEPLMFYIMVIFFIKQLYDRQFDARIIYHPISIAIFINLSWLIITSCTSEMPDVSFKYVLARLWFVTCFYFIATQLFRNYKNIDRFLWLYVIPLTIVIMYTVINHAMHGFEEKPAHWVMQPFFKDHTSYGAIVIMLFPVLFYFLSQQLHMAIKFFTGLLVVIFTLGAIFSYTRAAWVSFAISVVLMFIYKFRIKFTHLLLVASVALALIANSWSDILMVLEKNRQDSSGNLSEHVQSISNISSDASNLERINRWECALKMFMERPLFGWGPGTYMFQYAPFQRSKNLTIISTNNADNGNAHSEYIGPLAETGVPGLLSFLLIVILTYYYGSTLFHRLPKGQTKNLLLFLLAGFTTYLTHGFLNNYLDTDKASVPFWGFIAIIVALDVYHKNRLLEKG